MKKPLCLSMFHVVLSGAVAVAAPMSEDLSFVADLDGSVQKYVKITPTALPDKEIDVVIWLHGHGSDRTQVSQSRGECSGSRDFCEQNGMLLVSPDYRATTSWMGPAAEADTVQLIGILKAAYDVRRIFLVGGSMGGTAALTFAGLHPDLVDGVAAFNPLADHMTYENFQDAIAASFGGTKAEIPDVYRARSAINHVDELTMPLSITVGGADTSVPPDSARELARLVERKYPGHVYIDDVASRGHETDYGATVRALRQMLSRADGTVADEVSGGMPPGLLVAWWPFGKYGLADASGNGHALVAGPGVAVGEAATIAGQSGGISGSGLSVSDIQFSQMEAVTVEIWLRLSAAPNWQQELVELSSNFNSTRGGFICLNDEAGLMYHGVNSSAGISMVMSDSAVLTEKVGDWRHVAVVIAKGSYSESMKIYVDGEDVTTPYKTCTASTTSLVFADTTLYFGGRNGAATVLGEMDSMKVWNHAMSADEVRTCYANGREKDPRQFDLEVTGFPADIECAEMSPGYGGLTCTNGEVVSFSARCGLEDVKVSGWRVYTNATASSERILLCSGVGSRGSFVHPGVFCNLEWQFSVPSVPVVTITSPLEISGGTVSFMSFASNGSAGDVRVLAVLGNSPTSLDTTNELALVTSPRVLPRQTVNLPPGGARCVRLVAVGPTGDVVAISPIKVIGQQVEIRRLCYYPFGDMGYRDASGNGLDLTATGLVSLNDQCGVTFATAANTKLVTGDKLNLSGLNSFVASCWIRNIGSPTGPAIFMEQNSPSFYGISGAFCILYETSTSAPFLQSITAEMKVKKVDQDYAVIASDKGELDGEWHHVAAVFSKKGYPDDVQMYIDGVNKSREITVEEKESYRGSATATTFANSPLTLGGRGSSYNLVGQMDEVVVAECPEGQADQVVAQLHAEGLQAVKGEKATDVVLVEVPKNCPSDQVFPPVGETYGYAVGETVPVVAEGRKFGRWACVLSTNATDSAEWVQWKKFREASGAFQHPGVAVKVSWRLKAGPLITVR